MRFTKNKIIAAIAIVAVLVAAYFASGPLEKSADRPATGTAISAGPSAAPATDAGQNAQTAEGKEGAGTGNGQSSDSGATQAEPSPSSPSGAASPAPSSLSPALSPSPTSTPAAAASPSSAASSSASPAASQSSASTAKPKPTSTARPAGSPTPSPSMAIDPKTGKDQYKTDPVPSGKPLPVEPQDAKITDKAMTAHLSVSCATILDHLDLLDPDKLELVPDDGVIFSKREVTFYEGESVFNVLQREMKKNKIHMEFENTPMYNSAYIEGINNLYEFDCGELSGWMYKVNGWFPNYGSSRYELKQGDVIEWVYTCDLGRDVGDAYNASGGGNK
ncbi:DUF4430 domain-containing protein [Cohnella sp. GCM10020058]|uniref:DUF4430 domain-containing protein n=1 Tax=Cohnella sp. GCM10020058 TaxID=3317330 RepID=UPI00363F74D9